MAVDPTFVFEGDKVYAMRDGKVLAAAEDLDELEQKLEEEESEEKAPKKKSSRIVTPTGLTGTILGRTPDVWGLSETLTVRLENGRIAHYKVADVVEEEYEEETPANPIQEFEETLEENVPADLDSLGERQEALASLKREARALISKGVSEADLNRLDQIIVTADAELAQIDDRLEFLHDENIQRFEPPAPFETQVVEQGGRPDGAGWLDLTLQDLVAEADEFDYQKLMDEGPEAFVAEQETDVLADQGATQFAAASYIREKTAGTEPEVREKYEKTWLARVEDLRRSELANRKEATQKEAAAEVEAHDDAPDDSLFL